MVGECWLMFPPFKSMVDASGNCVIDGLIKGNYSVYWQLYSHDSSGMVAVELKDTANTEHIITLNTQQPDIVEINPPFSLFPENGAADINVSTVLSWSIDSILQDSALFEIYLDTLPAPEALFSKGQFMSLIQISNLLPETDYY